MAVAEKSIAVEAGPRDQRQVLMVRGVLGALYVLASLWLVFAGLPMLWRLLNSADVKIFNNEFLADTLLFLVTLPTVFGLFLLGRRLEGPNPVRGLRACAFYLSACTIFFGLLITSGVPLWSVVGLVLLPGSILLYFLQPRFLDWLVQIEEQGWFHAVSYKANQGKRVRIATIAAVIVLVVFGIVKLILDAKLRTGTRWDASGAPLTDAWIVTMPFGTEQFVFLYCIPLTLPVLFMIAAGWFAWRLVNWPTFADFLIATEAEMNKVSWTSRKRLYQDTVVVLTTVVLMTVFLFVLDLVWVKILTNPMIQVLKFNPEDARRKNQAGAQW